LETQVGIDKLALLLLFHRRKRIHSAVDRRWGVLLQINCVVPMLSFRESF
jgi:hypothetical protein